MASTLANPIPFVLLRPGAPSPSFRFLAPLSVIADQLVVGSSGWMADFGEYVPPDSSPLSGEQPLLAHNRYPLDWQHANARAVANGRMVASGRTIPKAGADVNTGAGQRSRVHAQGAGDMVKLASAVDDDEAEGIVWFARSSTLASPGVVPLFWLGDQLHSWDQHDGLASTVVALLSSGVSGHTLTHSDTGGYTTAEVPLIVSYTRSLELLQRWTELNTFSAFLRTHEGSAPSENVQPYDAGASLAHFARFSRIFASLAPYRRELMLEASSHGWPLVRPLWLHHEDDPATLDLDAQFLLGEDVLVAPVLQPGATSVRAYLPKGQWRGAFTGKVINSQGEWVNAVAPIGEPAAFVRLDEQGLPRPSLERFLEAIDREQAV